MAHLRYWNNLPLFPREFGLYRNKIYKEQYVFILNRHYNREDCYVAVYSEGQLEQNRYDTLFLEARDETKDLEQAILDRDMIRGALEKLDIGYRCFFSGGRSYHFYLDFEPIPVHNFSAMVRNFVNDIDIFDLLDAHTVGNKRSMARIPYTYNTRNGRYAVYSMTENAFDLDYLAANGIIEGPPVLGVQPTSIFKYLRPDDDYDVELLKPAEVAFDGIYPDCVLNIMTKIRMEKHAGHNERIHYAAFLYKLGYSFDDIVDAFRDTSDFNPEVAETQIRGIIGDSYRPYACSRVKAQMDVCPFKRTNAYCHYIRRLIMAREKASEAKK